MVYFSEVVTSTFLAQGMAFAKKAFGEQEDAKPDYNAIASAVFSSPPIATVGLTEEEAIEQHKNVDVFTSSFRSAANHPSILQCHTFSCSWM